MNVLKTYTKIIIKKKKKSLQRRSKIAKPKAKAAKVKSKAAPLNSKFWLHPCFKMMFQANLVYNLLWFHLDSLRKAISRNWIRCMMKIGIYSKLVIFPCVRHYITWAWTIGQICENLKPMKFFLNHNFLHVSNLTNSLQNTIDYPGVSTAVI